MTELQNLLVDARPVDHPTARNRGVGRQTIGMLSGLHQIGVPLIALVESDAEADLLGAAVVGIHIERWSPALVRQYAVADTWFLCTQLMLHPIPLDVVPRTITEAGLPVAAIMHDVIPERYPELYQVDPTPRAQVQLRGMLTRTLDALLAVSQFAATTAAHELRFPPERVRVIGAGVDAAFQPTQTDPWPRLRASLVDDGRKVVLMVSGTDARKNTERLICAWGLLAPSTRSGRRLVIAASISTALLHRWQTWADEAGVADSVTFTGGVTDDEMVALHQVAILAIMPSTEEGFGLPVLEAAACGCPVIVSDCSSLPEVLDFPAAEFDPYDASSIAAAIERALDDPSHRLRLLAAGQRAVERWTWANTGRAVLESLESLGPRQARQLRPPPHRIALIGRFDESPTGLDNEALVIALRAAPHAPELHVLVDNQGTDVPTHAMELRFPERALGRFVHRSLFDHVVTIDVDEHGNRTAREATGETLTLTPDSTSAATALLDCLQLAASTAPLDAGN